MLFLWLVLLQLVIFGVLVLFLRVIIMRNVTTATAHLHTLNADYTEKISAANAKQAEADKYYDETILKAKKEAEMTKAQLLKEGHESRDASIAEARKTSTDILEQAARAREKLIQEIESEANRRAFDKAAEILREVIPEEIGPELHSGWVAELLKTGLENLAKLNVPASLKAATVTTAYPLSAAEKRALAATVKDKIGRDLEIEEKVDLDLLAGFKIALGSVEVDGSLRNRIREKVRHAQHAA